jgi:hypothetical protein
MNTTMKTLSALAIVTAALAATAMPSSALPNPPGTYKGPGGRQSLPVQTTQPKAPPRTIFKNLGGLFTHGITCLGCGLPHLPPSEGGHGPVVWPGHGNNWGHGWNHGYGWNRSYGWRDRPEIYVEGRPEATAVSAPVQSAPVYAPAAAPQAAAEPCNCLTKQSLPDGSVQFQDICTKESAIASPMTVGAR